MVVTESEESVSLARFSMVSSSSERSGPADLLAAEEHVLHDVEVVGQREVLIDDLDARGARRPSARGSRRGSPSKKTSPESIE